MTVLQVCAYAAPYEGNFVKSLMMLEQELAKQGHKTIYAFAESARVRDWCQKIGKRTMVYYLPVAKAILRPKTYCIFRKIFEENPDIRIIHSHFELYDIPIVITAPKKVSVFWHLHDAIQNYSSIKYKLLHRVQYGLCHGNAKLLSVSEKHMAYVIGLGFPKKRAAFLPNGLDLERIKSAEESKEKPYDFLMFGWEFERKGVDLCLRAQQLLNGQAKICIVGNMDTQSKAEKYGLALTNVKIHLPVPDINALYAKSRCFLHISRGEGLSYALLEAVYAGLPVICSDIPENRFAEKFPTVRMVQSENAEKISREMLSIINQEKKVYLHEISESRKVIQNEYSIQHWTENVLAFYEV